jgi:thiamine pyrophosphate-dependent acetolactate synthase large subunit-like protein
VSAGNNGQMMAIADEATGSGGDFVIGALRGLGVRFIFGVPGGQTLAIIEALERAPDIRFITAHHESAAATMADAFGRLTRSPGVCLGTTGPGATNMLTGVGGAYRDSSPVLVLTCNNFTRDLERDDTQAADHTRIFESLTKRTWLVTDPSVIVQVLQEAYLVATSGCPGPVLVDFTRTALEARVEPFSMPDQRLLISNSLQRPGGDTEMVQVAVDALSKAERPVLWVGNGVQLSGAREEALLLAERLQIPAMTTFNSISALPTSHPLVFGPRSRMGTRLTAKVLAESDLVLAAGNSLNAVSTARWTTPLPETIIQVDIEPATIGRYYADRTIGLIGDAKRVLRQLTEASDSPTGVAGASRLEWVTELQDKKHAFYAEVRSWPESNPSPPGSVHPIDVVTRLRDQSPDDTMLVVDAGNAGVWSHFWETRQADRYIKPVGFGNMGFGVPASVAAKLTLPESPVFALVGDGSLGMSLAEIETLVREHLDVCIVLINDGGYGNIRQEQVLFYGKTGIGVDFGPIDYAGIARACGLHAATVQSADELDAEVRAFLSAPRPTLLDVKLDPEPSAWTFPLLAS